MSAPWSLPIRLSEIGRGVLRLTPEPDTATLARIGAAIGVDALNALKVEVTLKPWLDGVEMSARLSATVVQTCGISLDPFENRIDTTFQIRALPAGSKNAPEEQGRELAIDPEAEDPPEVLEGDTIEVGAYLVEYLALEVDPFPRKPDAVFEQPGGAEVISPFAALAALKDPKPPQ